MSTSAFLKAAIALALGVTMVSGCTSEIATPGENPETGDPDRTKPDEVGTAQEALVSKSLICGHTEGFPTYTFWGYTTVQFTNQNPNGSVAHVVYQAGIGSAEYRDIGTTVVTGGRWAGFTLGVTYLGYYDPSGNYHACLEGSHPAGAPELYVQTW